MVNNWPFTTMKICPIALKLAKVGSKVYQIINKRFKNWPNTFKISLKREKFRPIRSHCLKSIRRRNFLGKILFRSAHSIAGLSPFVNNARLDINATAAPALSP